MAPWGQYATVGGGCVHMAYGITLSSSAAEHHRLEAKRRSSLRSVGEEGNKEP